MRLELQSMLPAKKWLHVSIPSGVWMRLERE